MWLKGRQQKQQINDLAEQSAETVMALAAELRDLAKAIKDGKAQD